ncbi:S8 family serine peptidase [Deinococcus maricopensis]|uniref:Peptidase S8 and S53 subtilisin kexin sedolisin n=1 Tax=Deinococcus maricopensis (strain DSM 21211 / LMG 22137 / NRRL B-23946 / LB-34) TaxID=709986 RepID=E8U9L2_DEIML|nr:S8 family serine peptidase [Deinococcus maricopensis]ADV67751.1 peptidase S8 and S53 subtilisin kexin sedolisin [Deinococcus maricopensis DSM 21211]
MPRSALRLPALAALTLAVASAATIPALPPTRPTPPPSTTPAAPPSVTVPDDLAPLPEPPPTTPAPATAALPWNYQAIHLSGARTSATVASVTVAILDAGYTRTAASTALPGYDFVSDAARAGDGDARDRDPAASAGVATHPGLIADLISGINPRARLVQVRVADQNGEIDARDLADGLRWAAGLPVTGAPINTNPARIINASLFADFIPLTRCDTRVQAALDAVAVRGVLVVAGAANDNRDASGYTPAGCRGVLTVTATDRAGRRAPYANYGRAVALAAPGGTREDGIPTAYGPRDGTSLAAPHVAGVASLLLGLNPRLSPTQLRDLLTRTAAPFPGGRCDPDTRKTCGTGIVDAEAAVKAVSTVK